VGQGGPLRDRWSEYADAVVSAVGTGIVVVAESLSGFTAPLVCARRPIDLLVLLDAMIPMPGETGNAWWSNTGSGAARLGYHASIGLQPEEAEGDAVLYYHDLPAELAAEAQERAWQDQSRRRWISRGRCLHARRPDARRGRSA
jgi:hypothetical protein